MLDLENIAAFKRLQISFLPSEVNRHHFALLDEVQDEGISAEFPPHVAHALVVVPFVLLLQVEAVDAELSLRRSRRTPYSPRKIGKWVLSRAIRRSSGSTCGHLSGRHVGFRNLQL